MRQAWGVCQGIHHICIHTPEGDKGSITHIGFAVKGIDSVLEDLRAKGIPLLSDGIEDDDAPMGGLRVIQLLGPSNEHLNLYEWKRDF